MSDPTALPTYQSRVASWMQACFGPVVAADKAERNHRFLEEALELVQALGCTAEEAHQLVDYTFGRPAGEPRQEVGGVMVTLAALCRAQGLDMAEAGEAELARVWTKVEQIRAKQAAKPKFSPLPAPAPPPAAAATTDEATPPGFEQFAQYFAANYPAGEYVISYPAWHAVRLYRAALHAHKSAALPIDMVLHCPACGLQHIDAPDLRDRNVMESGGWENPPHRSHLCHGCGHIWRPADVPTNGVRAVKTTGKADSPIATDKAALAWHDQAESPRYLHIALDRHAQEPEQLRWVLDRGVNVLQPHDWPPLARELDRLLPTPFEHPWVK